jgi:methyl-accepting chemotaxis protein
MVSGIRSLVGRLSLTAKLVVVIVVVNLAGLAASVWMLDRSAEQSLAELAIDGWEIQTGQVAAAAAGGLKWKKADVVADSYAAYLANDRPLLSRVIAFDAAGGEVVDYVEPGFDPAALDATIRVEIDRKPTGLVQVPVDRAVLMVTPAGQSADGAAMGYVALAWKTDQLMDIRSSLRNDTLIVQLASTLALVLIVLFAIRALLGRPLGAVTRRIEALSAGDLDSDVSHQERRDEIGVIARALEGFRVATLDKNATDAQLDVERRQREDQRTESESQRAASAKVQAAVVKLIAAALSRLAEGDLTVRISVNFPPEYAKLKTDFNAAMETLGSSMRQIAESGGQLSVSTEEVRKAADELARRTEKQAASVEEAVAAVNDITNLVERTAAGAGSARDASVAARNDAAHSEQVVGNAIVAMAQIEKSSQEINKIIGVIDEIAFQTNLLALNAGVEAARAGDAGRGFVVVASEVRALAQRSAEAAKEIKGLISASGNQVKAGSKLVGETGEVIARIGEQVQRINTIIAEIAGSATEQAHGLRGISQAMGGIDMATQQNAAMAEQFTAASHSLAEETGVLAQLIDYFSIGESAPAPKPKPASSYAQPRMPRAVGATALDYSHDLERQVEDWQEF